ncbi:hypothetical protein HMI56_005581 [Coelomomyces lativittatus]|nr:hypothetical protein HMI56_005581 [Coelomomyces lativittatus]
MNNNESGLTYFNIEVNVDVDVKDVKESRSNRLTHTTHSSLQKNEGMALELNSASELELELESELEIYPPVCSPDPHFTQVGTLILKDGYMCQGYSFGATKPMVGECVFQTGT